MILLRMDSPIKHWDSQNNEKTHKHTYTTIKTISTASQSMIRPDFHRET